MTEKPQMKRYSITVPTTKVNGALIFKPKRKQELEKSVKELTKLAGGTTMYSARGSFVHANGAVSVEEVTVVEVWSEKSIRPQLLMIADRLKLELEQEKIFITSNGKGELI
jgi:hypothetical protein